MKSMTVLSFIVFAATLSGAYADDQTKPPAPLPSAPAATPFEPYQMDDKKMGDVMAAIRACGNEQFIAHNTVWVVGDCVANVKSVLLAQEAKALEDKKAADAAKNKK